MMTFTEIVTFINTWINPIAIFITIVLFVIFIVGKIITSTRGRWDATEDLIIDPSDEVLNDLIQVYKFESDRIEGAVLLTSDETLYNVKLQSLKMKKKKPKLSRKGERLLNNNKKYTNIKKLHPNEGVLFKVSFPCGMPMYAVSWYKYNYMKATYYFAYDGKNGLKDKMSIQYKKTWRTYLYNFIR